MIESQKEIVSQVEIVHVSDEFEGQRIDNFLINRLKGVPKSKIYRIIRKGEVRVNKGRVKAEYRIQVGDMIRIPPLHGIKTKNEVFVGSHWQEQIRNNILYQDNGLLIINKPSGLAVHGGSGLKIGLIEALRQLFPGQSLELVHRLDRDTSGCVMIAKKRSVLRYLHEQLRTTKIQKHYHALVYGQWPKHKQLVDIPLEKNVLQSGERIVRVSSNGKSAKTQFKVLQRFKQYTLVEAKPITGRTHQIRVHAQHAGHSIVGDEKYSAAELNQQAKVLGFKRLFLHAAALTFYLPDINQPITVSAELDQQLINAMEKLPR